MNDAEIDNEKVALLNELWVRLYEDDDIDNLVMLFS